MRLLAALALVALAPAAGCLDRGGGGADVAGEDCETEAALPSAEGGKPVTLWVANEVRGAPQCLRVRLAGDVILVASLPAPREGLPAGYRDVGTFTWSGASLALDAQTAPGTARGEGTFATADENHVILTVLADRVRVEHQESAPDYG